MVRGHAMSRPILDETRLHPAIRDRVANAHADIVHNVQAAAQAHPVLVVNLGWNGYGRRARQALDAAGIAHHDLDFGNYLSGWRRRLALKMWTGWPTFPMVFVRGVLVGGCADVERLIASGELKRTLGTPGS